MSADNIRFHTEHLWCDVGEQSYTRVGISEFAQESLGDIVFFKLPDVGDEISAGESMGTVESLKVVNDLIAPVSGRVVEVNSALADTPTLANDDPYGEGWLVQVQIADQQEISDLMEPAAYQSMVGD